MNKKIGLINSVTKILMHISFVLLILILAVGPILLDNANTINGALGIVTQVGSGSSVGEDAMYSQTKYETMDEVQAESKDLIEEAMAEGAALLKNGDVNGTPALPLTSGDSVSMFGAVSRFNIFSGQGSSGAYDGGASGYRTTLQSALDEEGFDVNSDLYSWYGTQGDNVWYTDTANKIGSTTAFSGGSAQELQLIVNDIAWDNINTDARDDAADAAIVVFGRQSGEACDLYMDTTMDDGETRVILSRQNNGDASKSVGDALRLTDNEQSILTNLNLQKKAGKIGKIIVVMNSTAPLNSDFIDEEQYGVDAAMWVGTVGSTGNTAIAKLLTGEYNPSGRVTDTFWANSKYNPVHYNYGSIAYENSSSLANYFANMNYYNNKYYVVYQEGIYNGYKYTETRYEDVVLGRDKVGEFEYSDAVSYPFGYGLSYTNFTYSNFNVAEKADGTYDVTVDVTNNTDIGGKDAVQIYLQKPYTDKDILNGVEKSAVELVGYAKPYIAGKATETVEINVDEKFFAAYDSYVEKTYVIGSEDKSDKYLLTAAKDSHDAANNFLQYKKANGESIDETKMYANAERDMGNAGLVWSKYIDYDNETYSTNEFIEQEIQDDSADYNGDKVNYGVDKITNQLDSVDFKTAGIFSDSEENQKYLSRNDWEGTYGQRIVLTANDALVEAQKTPDAPNDDASNPIEYPTYEKVGFYEGAGTLDEIKLIYLRGKDFHDELWDTLLDRVMWDESCTILQNALRFTNTIESIAAPSSSQQNGSMGPNHQRSYSELPDQNGFRGFAELYDSGTDTKPPLFPCNYVIGGTFNDEFAYEYGIQIGEECAWAGYNGLYGLGINIHRGGYNGRGFEYYSEDGFLSGMIAGYQTVGMEELGVFCLAKHAVLNDQETHRAGGNSWANEQSVREIYLRPFEITVDLEYKYVESPIFGVMTGMNRMGAVWCGGQGFCNTVLRAEFGMRGFAVSDYNSSRPYISTIHGVLNGNDLPDGNPANAKSGYDYDGNDLRFVSYEEGHAELAWAMRNSIKNVLYTVVNSNTMNGITGDSTFSTITPAWEIAIPVVTRVIITITIWFAGLFFVSWGVLFAIKASKKSTFVDEGDKE